MKKIELLAPAGNFECMVAAINNGANAVYLGGTLFSARAFAGNFDHEQIIEAVKYAHLRDVKVYVTINTLMNELEIEKAISEVKFYYENNVDALLIQDLGLFYLIRSKYPDFEVHASTQLHIHNLQGVQNAKELGFSRVVVARESSLAFIKDACKEDIEIETFVHGAICVSYSGQCLMSSLTKNRSANKGMCAQCCRLRYELYENGKRVDTDTDYLLSPKDMFLLENIPDLIDAGVSSLKIEGRMKSAAYVGYVTGIYREAIDSYYEGKKFEINQVKLTKLKSLFYRGFTNTYLLHNNAELFDNQRPNHIGIEIGKVIKVFNRIAYIKLSGNINQFDGIRINDGNSDGEGMILNKLTVDGKLVSKAFKNEIIEVPVEYAKVGNMVFKTKDSQLEKEILEVKDIKITINYKISVEPGKKININVYNDEVNYSYISDVIPDIPLKKPITEQNIADVFSKVGEHPYKVNNVNIEMKPSFISLKVLNEIRRDILDKFDDYRLASFKRKTKMFETGPLTVNQTTEDLIQYCNDTDKNHWNFSEVINNESLYAEDYNFVSDFGGLLLKGHKIGSYTLNITNSYAYEFLLRLGFENTVLSLELNKELVNMLIESFKKRTKYDIHPYIFTYGRRELMHLARNPFERYIKNLNNAYLTDGKNRYLLIKRKNSIDILEYDPYMSNIKDYIDCLSYKKVNYSMELDDID